jgi:PEP-CTERM motif
MNKIPPTILIIVISLFLSGCVESNGSGTKFSSLVGGSDESLVNYYSSSGSSGDSSSDNSLSTYYDSSLGSSGSDSGGAVGHHNPEPASIALLGAGLAAILGKKIRRQK